MQFLKNLVDRQERSQFRLLKFHLLTHMAHDILKFGPPSAYNSATGESNHKQLKRRSRRTQKRANLMTEQTGNRYVEQLAVMKTLSSKPETKVQDDSSLIRFTGYSYYMNTNGIFDCTKDRLLKTEAVWFDPILQKSIFSLLKNEILPNMDENSSIRFMTNLIFDHNNYRGDPNFKDGTWHDWAYCDWGARHGICPIQIQIFVDLQNLKKELTINGVQVSPNSQYAFVHMVDNPLDKVSDDGTNFKAHSESKIFFKAEKWLDDNNEPVLALVNVDSIVSPCIGVKYCSDTQDNFFLFMKPRSDWPELLSESINKSVRSNKLC
jgi:hypothetical protein